MICRKIKSEFETDYRKLTSIPNWGMRDRRGEDSEAEKERSSRVTAEDR